MKSVCPSGDPAASTVNGTSPGVTLGTVTLNWYSPTAPGASPAYASVAAVPPNLNVSGFGSAVLAGATVPAGVDGVTGPQPIAYIVITSPALAGRKLSPPIRPV